MFIASSFRPLKNYHFIGHCFIGADFVVGQPGAEKYLQITGELPRPNLDGCYVVARPEANGWQIGTDSKGLSRLFLYKRGAVWAVGSSLYGLVTHLREHGIYPSPKLSFIKPLAVPGSFTSQLSSLATPFEGIELVPSFCTVLIKQDAVEVHPLPQKPRGSYEADLEDYLTTWMSRLATLTSHPDSRITTDLTGGLDSRVVFAFLVASGNFDTFDTRRFRVVSNPNSEDDFNVASQIAEHYSISLNSPGHQARALVSGEEALKRWRINNLGVYLPVYLQNDGFDPLTIHAHGAGGESYRQYYTNRSIVAKLSNYKSRLDAQIFREWSSSVSESIVRLSKTKPDVEPLVLHYREFRNRFHFGHRPHNRAMFTPLNSAMLDGLASRHSLDSRQLLFDITESLAPDLMDFKFDTDSKAPSPEERSQLTTVDFSISDAGVIYGLDGLDVSKQPSDSSAYRLWLAECHQILDEQENQKLMNSEQLLLCKETLREAADTKKPLGSHHEGMVALSLAQTLAFINDIEA